MKCAEEDRADAVILGGAGLVGLGARLQPRVAVRIVDCLEAAIEVALSSAVRTGAGDLPDPVQSVGLSRALADRLEGKEADRSASRT